MSNERPQYLITGCSGAGKSALIEELARRGFEVVREPGRRLVAQGIEPWRDLGRFLRMAEALAWNDLTDAATMDGPVFFDRGVLDAAAGLERISGEPMEARLGNARPYNPRVLFAGEWPEIFVNDEGRRHSMDAARREEDHLRRRLPELGYSLEDLPQTGIADRADFVLAWVGALLR